MPLYFFVSLNNNHVTGRSFTTSFPLRVSAKTSQDQCTALPADCFQRIIITVIIIVVCLFTRLLLDDGHQDGLHLTAYEVNENHAGSLFSQALLSTPSEISVLKDGCIRVIT